MVPTCDTCKGNGFIDAVLPALRGPDLALRRAAWKFCEDVLVFLRVTSLSVERQHLKMAVKRTTIGGKLAPINASLSTYTQLVSNEWEIVRDELLQDTFVGQNRSVARVFETRGTRPKAGAKPRAKPKSVFPTRLQPRNRQVTGWNEYVADHGGVGTASPATWRNLTEAERRIYEDRAEEKTNTRTKARECHLASEDRSCSLRGVTRARVHSAIQGAATSALWQEGLGNHPMAVKAWCGVEVP